MKVIDLLSQTAEGWKEMIDHLPPQAVGLVGSWPVMVQIADGRLVQVERVEFDPEHRALVVITDL